MEQGMGNNDYKNQPNIESGTCVNSENPEVLKDASNTGTMIATNEASSLPDNESFSIRIRNMREARSIYRRKTLLKEYSN